MKTQCCLWLIGLLGISSASAQKLKQRDFFLANGSIDVRAGVSIPTLDYALSDFSLPAGYAQTGYVASIGFNYDIAPFLGVVFQFQHLEHPFNNDKFFSDLKAASSYQINSYHSDPWRLNNLMLGVYYPFKSSKMTIDVGVMGVLCSAVLPQAEENFTVQGMNNTTFNLKQFENTSNQMGVQGIIKLRYQLHKNLLLASSIEFLYAKVTFEDIRIVDTNLNLQYMTDDYTQKFQVVNISAGLAYQFN